MEFKNQIEECKVSDSNNLSPIDVVNLYHYICEYESFIKHEPGQFDISNKELDKFIRHYDIYFDTCAKKNVSKAKKHDHYMLFEQNKNSKASKNDKAHHLLRHIRNSIAHGWISKVDGKTERYNLTDNNGRKDTMWGYIGVKVLYQLITKLIESKKSESKWQKM